MLITIGFFLMSVPLFIGAFKMFRTSLALGLEGIGRVYGSFYLGLGLFLFTIAVSSIMPFSPILLQQIIFIALFGMLYTTLGFVYLFSFLLLGRKTIGFLLLTIHVFFAVLFLYIYVPPATGVVVLLPDNPLFTYRDPGYTPLATLFSLALVIFAASVYSRFLFKTGVESASGLVRKRSFIFAIGSVVAAFSGTTYFISPFLPIALVPYVVAASSIPGVIGFSLMVWPLFLKEEAGV